VKKQCSRESEDQGDQRLIGIKHVKMTTKQMRGSMEMTGYRTQLPLGVGVAVADGMSEPAKRSQL